MRRGMREGEEEGCTNWDAHAIAAQIPQPQDSLPVRQHCNPDVLFWPMLQYARHSALQQKGTTVNLRAYKALCWRSAFINDVMAEVI